MKKNKIIPTEERRNTHYHLGFTFTQEEVNAMNRAIAKSKKFMTSYGKGEKPMMVDLRHYLQCDARIDYLKKIKK